MRKRYRLRNKKRFFSFLFLLFATALIIGSVTANAGSVRTEYRTITVMPGDTLWDIAQDNAGSEDVRKYIYEIKKVNQLDNATIYAGQKLYLP